MNKKKLLTVALIVLTVLVGAVTVYVSYKLRQPVEELPQTGRFSCSCTSYATFCGGEKCTFAGYSPTDCPVGSIAACYQPNQLRCVGYDPKCGCSCGDGPEPRAGYERTSCTGSYDYVERYTTLCWACNNPYFCQTCYKKLPTPTPSPSPKPSLSPSPSPSLSPSPKPSLSLSPSPKPSLSPSPSPSPSPKPSLSPSPKPSLSPSPSPKPTIVPTALISDEADRLIIGFALLALGLAIYKSKLYVNIGNLFWNNAVMPATSASDVTYANVSYKLNAITHLIKNFFVQIYNKVSLFFLRTVKGGVTTAHKLKDKVKVVNTVANTTVDTIKTVADTIKEDNIEKKKIKRIKNMTFEERMMEEIKEDN